MTIRTALLACIALIAAVPAYTQMIGSGFTYVPDKKLYLDKGYTTLGASDHVLFYTVDFHHYEKIAGAIYADVKFNNNHCRTYCIKSRTGNETCAGNAMDIQFPHYPSIKYISFEYFFIFDHKSYSGTESLGIDIESAAEPVRILLNVPVDRLINDDGTSRFTKVSDLLAQLKITDIRIKEVAYADNVIAYFNKLAAFAEGNGKVADLRKELEKAERSESINRQLSIALSIQQLSPKDNSNNSRVAALQSKLADKKKLEQRLKAISENNTQEKLNIRKQLGMIDPNDLENNTNIGILEDKLDADKKAQVVKENKAFDKQMHNATVQQNTRTITNNTYTPQKTNEQQLQESTTQLANSLAYIFRDRTEEKLEYKRKVESYNAQREQEEAEKANKSRHEFDSRMQSYWDELKESKRNYPYDHDLFIKSLNENTTKSFSHYLVIYGREDGGRGNDNEALNLGYTGNGYRDKYGGTYRGFYLDVAYQFYRYHTKQLRDIDYAANVYRPVKIYDQNDAARLMRYAIGWSMWNIVQDLLQKGVPANDTYITSEWQPQYSNYHLLQKLETDDYLSQESKDYLFKLALNSSVTLFKRYVKWSDGFTLESYFLSKCTKTKDLDFVRSFATGRYTNDSSRAVFAYALLSEFRSSENNEFLVNAIRELIKTGIDYTYLFKPWQEDSRRDDVRYGHYYLYHFPLEELFLHRQDKSMNKGHTRTLAADLASVMEDMVNIGHLNKQHFLYWSEDEFIHRNSDPLYSHDYKKAEDIKKHYDYLIANFMVADSADFTPKDRMLPLFFSMGYSPEEIYRNSKTNKSAFHDWKKYNRTPEIEAWENYKSTAGLTKGNKSSKPGSPGSTSKVPLWSMVNSGNSTTATTGKTTEPVQSAVEEFAGMPGALEVVGLINSKNYREAINRLNTLIKKHRENYLLFGLRGDCKFQLKDYTGSLDDYDAGLKLNSTDTALLNASAWAKARLKKDLPKAEEQVNRALKIAPANYRFNDTRAFILQQQGKYSEAKKQYDITLRMGGDTVGQIVERYGDVLYELGMKEEAITQWKKAKQLGGEISPGIDNKISQPASGTGTKSPEVTSTPASAPENEGYLTVTNEHGVTLRFGFEKSIGFLVFFKLEVTSNDVPFNFSPGAYSASFEIDYKGVFKVNTPLYNVAVKKERLQTGRWVFEHNKKIWNGIYDSFLANTPELILFKVYSKGKDQKEEFVLTSAQASQLVQKVKFIGKME